MSEERIYLPRYVGKAKKGDKCSLEPMKYRLHDEGINVQKQSPHGCLLGNALLKTFYIGGMNT